MFAVFENAKLPTSSLPTEGGSGNYFSEMVFQLQPTPRDSSPTTTDPFPRESISSRFSVIFKSILSRFRVAIRNRLKIDSKTTEKRLEIDSLGEGSVVVGDESRVVGCS